MAATYMDKDKKEKTLFQDFQDLATDYTENF